MIIWGRCLPPLASAVIYGESSIRYDLVKCPMPSAPKNSVINSTLHRIDDAIAALQKQVEADPEFAEDADYIDRMTVEGGRKRIMERRKA